MLKSAHLVNFGPSEDNPFDIIVYYCTLLQICSLSLDVSVSRRSRDLFSQRLGLGKLTGGLGLVSDSLTSRSRALTSRLHATSRYFFIFSPLIAEVNRFEF